MLVRDSFGLTAEQRRWLTARTTAESDDEACRSVRLPHDTIQRWLAQEPSFYRAYSLRLSAVRDIIEHVRGEIAGRAFAEGYSRLEKIILEGRDKDALRAIEILFRSEGRLVDRQEVEHAQALPPEVKIALERRRRGLSLTPQLTELLRSYGLDDI